MQVFGQGTVEDIEITVAVYGFKDIVDNDIGETGANHLSKGDWKDLILLHLSILLFDQGHNQIKSGLESLIKGNWKDLKKFYISSYTISQDGTR